MQKFNGINSGKRKELEEFNDDFSEFSLSSPARKIRRLDMELPPIVEEDDTIVSMRYEQEEIPNNVILNGVGVGDGLNITIPDIEELPPFVRDDNDKKAIVLFKPMKTQISPSPGSTFSIDPKLIASFKNQAFWGVRGHAGQPNLTDDDEYEDKEKKPSCRAVIPWVPPQQLILKPEAPGFQTEEEEEEPDVMEIEDDREQTSDYCCISRSTEGVSAPWQQQHCTLPQPPENTTTPVVWYR